MFTEKDTFNPNLNPSDEKLREIIAEKDAEIKRLKRWCASEKQIINLCECSGDEYCALILKGAEKDAEIERLKAEGSKWKESAIKGNWPYEWSALSKLNEENKSLQKEIQELKTSDLARVTETLTEKLIEKEAEIARLKEKLEAINKAASECDMHGVAINWQAEELLAQVEARKAAEKDAERYKKFRAHGNQGQNATFLGWSVDMSYADNSIEFDAAVDALPEVES